MFQLVRSQRDRELHQSHCKISLDLTPRIHKIDRSRFLQFLVS